MIRDGTVQSGERNPAAKLTAADVAEIRNRVAAGETQRAVARRYGVSKGALCLMISGKTWATAGGPVRTAPNRRPGAKLTPDAVEDIRRRVAAGETQRSVASEHGVSQGAVNMIILGRTWRRH